MQDTLTLTIRIHDPKEKKNAALSTNWAPVEVPREDLALSKAEFIAKWIEPALATMTGKDKILQLT
jgi:hypothetical protein